MKKRWICLLVCAALITGSAQGVYAASPSVWGLHLNRELAAVLLCMGEEETAYCAQPGRKLLREAVYTPTQAREAGGLYAENEQALIRVLKLGYPALEGMRRGCGIADLTREEAVTATQLAVWTLTQGYMICMGEERVDRALVWLLQSEESVQGTLRVWKPDRRDAQELVGLAQEKKMPKRPSLMELLTKKGRPSSCSGVREDT